MATTSDVRRLETIIGKIENLQNLTADPKLKERLQSAKSELFRALSESDRL